MFIRSLKSQKGELVPTIETTDQILNLIKEALDGLTVIGDEEIVALRFLLGCSPKIFPPYGYHFSEEALIRLIKTVDQARLSKDIKEIKDRLGI